MLSCSSCYLLQGGREGEREGGREGERREGGREGEREGGREGGRKEEECIAPVYTEHVVVHKHALGNGALSVSLSLTNMHYTGAPSLSHCMANTCLGAILKLSRHSTATPFSQLVEHFPKHVTHDQLYHSKITETAIM